MQVKKHESHIIHMPVTWDTYTQDRHMFKLLVQRSFGMPFITIDMGIILKMHTKK